MELAAPTDTTAHLPRKNYTKIAISAFLRSPVPHWRSLSTFSCVFSQNPQNGTPTPPTQTRSLGGGGVRATIKTPPDSGAFLPEGGSWAGVSLFRPPPEAKRGRPNGGAMQHNRTGPTAGHRGQGAGWGVSPSRNSISDTTLTRRAMQKPRTNFIRKHPMSILIYSPSLNTRAILLLKVGSSRHALYFFGPSRFEVI